MNLVKKIAIGATTAAILLSSAAPTFAASNAWNKNISNGSFAKAKAIDNDNYTAVVSNTNTIAVNLNLSIAGTGGNTKNGKGDGNIIQTGGAHAEGWNANEVNRTIIKF